MTISVLLLALALAADAFAVSIGKGLAVGSRANLRGGLTIGLWFGGFQALMPVLGWLAAATMASLIERWDHWIAFVLLVGIGANMIREAIAGEEEADAAMGWRPLLVLALATSIDALAAGITLSVMNVSVVAAVATIGVVTCLLSGLGFRLGSLLGARWQRLACALGGVVLIALGGQILLEHTGILG